MFTEFVLFLTLFSCVRSQTQIIIPPLPYAYNALEPVLSEHLMKLHHGEHFRTYINKTNIALRALYADKTIAENIREIAKLPIEIILTKLQKLPDQYHVAIRHNGGGYLNHKLFFSMLKAPTATATENKPTGPLLEAIEKGFGSFDRFKQMFTITSTNFFGYGWIWLYIDAQRKQLVLNYTTNQDNPIMFNENHIVLLALDLWEHAYYPVYENRPDEYIENFWRIVNWPSISQLYVDSQTKRNEL